MKENKSVYGPIEHKHAQSGKPAKTSVCNECPLRLTTRLYEKDGRKRCPDETFADCTMRDVRKNLPF